MFSTLLRDVTCLRRNVQLLADLQFARVSDLVQLEQIGFRNFQVARDRDRVVAFHHGVDLARILHPEFWFRLRLCSSTFSGAFVSAAPRLSSLR